MIIVSGIPRDRISELHGNTTHERCEDCGARYERTRGVRSGGAPPRRCKGCGHNHRTGRKCERKVSNHRIIKPAAKLHHNTKVTGRIGLLT